MRPILARARKPLPGRRSPRTDSSRRTWSTGAWRADARTVRIGMTIGGDVLARPSAPPDVVADARRAEDEGFATAWSVHFSRAYDALTTLAVAGTLTSADRARRRRGADLPAAPAGAGPAGRHRADVLRGRLTLGVGVSHRPVIEGLHGLPYASPAAHMREYLTVLGPLLRGEPVTFAGEHYRVDGGFAVPGAQPVSVLVGALSPRMVRVAGELADGVITWLVGPRSLGDVVDGPAGRPRRPRGAPARRRAAGRRARRPRRRPAPPPRSLRPLQRPGELPPAVRARGVPSVGALAVVGTEADVEKQLRRLADLGVTDLWPGRSRSDRRGRACAAPASCWPVCEPVRARAGRRRVRRRGGRRAAAARRPERRRPRARARPARARRDPRCGRPRAARRAAARRSPRRGRSSATTRRTARSTTAASAGSPRRSAATRAGCTPDGRAARPCGSRCGCGCAATSPTSSRRPPASCAAVAQVADAHAETLMVDQTYLQHAQPSTFGHFLLGSAYPVLRTVDRLTAGLDGINRSPAGAGGVNGSPLTGDRERMAALLGFDGVIEHTRDAMWQSDGLTALVGGRRHARHDPGPARRGPGDLRQRGVRLGRPRRRAHPLVGAHAAEAQPVRARRWSAARPGCSSGAPPACWRWPRAPPRAATT